MTSETGSGRLGHGPDLNAASAGRREFMNVEFDRATLPELVEAVVEARTGDKFRYVVTPNVDHMLRIVRRPEIAALYRDAWLCINDSRILQRLARISGLSLPAVPGADLAVALLAGAALPPDTPILVVGGDPDLAAELGRRFGFTQIRQHRPPMGILTDPKAFGLTVAAVERSEARIVFLAVGSPQQELLAAALKERGRAQGVGLCIGAALEFMVGSRRRAPRWMRDAGLEWAFRLGSEPGRLWRRYLVDGPQIFGLYLAYRRSRHAGAGR